MPKNEVDTGTCEVARSTYREIAELYRRLSFPSSSPGWTKDPEEPDH